MGEGVFSLPTPFCIAPLFGISPADIFQGGFIDIFGSGSEDLMRKGVTKGEPIDENVESIGGNSYKNAGKVSKTDILSARTRLSTSQTGGKVPGLVPDISEVGRENQMIALAYDVAEKQLLEGKASSQVITHFLKLGTLEKRLELEKLRLETELVKAKTESLHSARHIEELYTEALKAMKTYSGTKDDLV